MARSSLRTGLYPKIRRRAGWPAKPHITRTFAYFSARSSVVRVRPLKTRGEFCLARSFVFVRFEEAIGKLSIADVADDFLHVIR